MASSSNKTPTNRAAILNGTYQPPTNLAMLNDLREEPKPKPNPAMLNYVSPAELAIYQQRYGNPTSLLPTNTNTTQAQPSAMGKAAAKYIQDHKVSIAMGIDPIVKNPSATKTTGDRYANPTSLYPANNVAADKQTTGTAKTVPSNTPVDSSYRPTTNDLAKKTILPNNLRPGQQAGNGQSPKTANQTAQQNAEASQKAAQYVGQEMDNFAEQNSYVSYDDRRKELQEDYREGKISRADYVYKTAMNDLLQLKLERGLSDAQFVEKYEALQQAKQKADKDVAWSLGLSYPKDKNVVIETAEKSRRKNEELTPVNAANKTTVIYEGLGKKITPAEFKNTDELALKEVYESQRRNRGLRILDQLARDKSSKPLSEGSKEAKDADSALSYYISMANNELIKGYKEKKIPKIDKQGNIKMEGDNNSPYGPQGFWCAMFVSWCADQAGIPKSVIPRGTAVERDMIDVYNKDNRYMEKESGYIPKAGDTIFFLTIKDTDGDGKKDNQYHVGIVTAYDPETETVYTIEGNSNDTVAQNHYDIHEEKEANKKHIIGYGVNGGTSYGDVPGTKMSPNSEQTR